MRAQQSQRNEVREKEEEARRGIPRWKVNAIKQRSRARRADVQAGGRLVAKSRIDNKTNYAGTAIIKVAVDAVSSGGRQRTGDILDRAESQSRVSAVASCRVASRLVVAIAGQGTNVASTRPLGLSFGRLAFSENGSADSGYATVVSVSRSWFTGLVSSHQRGSRPAGRSPGGERAAKEAENDRDEARSRPMINDTLKRSR